MKKNNCAESKDKTKATFNSPGSVETPEEEKLARDFYEMSHAVAAALGSQGYLATGDKEASPSTSRQVSRPSSPSTNSLDSDQALPQTYKEALKDLQFLSCDIEGKLLLFNYSKLFYLNSILSLLLNFNSN